MIPERDKHTLQLLALDSAFLILCFALVLSGALLAGEVAYLIAVLAYADARPYLRKNTGCTCDACR